MLLDICLVFLTTTQVILINGPTTAYSRAVERFFHDIFLLNDAAFEKEFNKKKYLYTIDDITNLVRKSHDNYFDIDDISLGNITLEKTDKESVLPIDILSVNKDDLEGKHFTQHNMTIDDYWIFNLANTNKYIKSELIKLKYFTINYKVKSYDPINFGDYYECILWDIRQKFSFEKRYHYIV